MKIVYTVVNLHYSKLTKTYPNEGLQHVKDIFRSLATGLVNQQTADTLVTKCTG